MKSDTERKMFHKEKLHRRKNRMHAHLSKDLRGKLKTKKRSILIHKGDKVKVMRGAHAGKEAKVARVSHAKRKAFLEGISVTNARAKDVPQPFEVSNLMLLSLEPTSERKAIFNEDAFKKEAPKKAAEPKAEPKAEKAPEPKGTAKEAEGKSEKK